MLINMIIYHIYDYMSLVMRMEKSVIFKYILYQTILDFNKYCKIRQDDENFIFIKIFCTRNFLWSFLFSKIDRISSIKLKLLHLFCVYFLFFFMDPVYFFSGKCYLITFFVLGNKDLSFIRKRIKFRAHLRPYLLLRNCIMIILFVNNFLCSKKIYVPNTLEPV